MNYDLALELKNVGFPQGPYQAVFDEVKEHPERADAYAEAYGVKSLSEVVYQPALSELISACGERFKGLIVNTGPLASAETRWCAAENGSEIRLGQTPEIAVARLWLALNKKS